jgi:hypothetical protein
LDTTTEVCHDEMVGIIYVSAHDSRIRKDALNDDSDADANVEGGGCEAKGEAYQ